MKKEILRQSIIFIIYFFLCSIVLFGRGGGGDIAFVLFIAVCIALHLLLIVIKLIIDRPKDHLNKWTIKDVGALAILGVGFLAILFPYLKLMWWVTSKFH